MSLDLVRNRPQFDLDVLKPGVAIKYKYEPDTWCTEKDRKYDYCVWYNAIIIKATATRLTITQYDEDEGVAEGVLDLEIVLDGRLDIKVLS